MKSRLAAAMLLGCGFALSAPVAARSAMNIPPSETVKHDSVLAYLRQLAERKTETGVAARQLIDVLTEQMALEDALILPPLTLIPTLAAGRVTPDMNWAITNSDTIRAKRDLLRELHDDVVAAILDLRAAANAENDDVTIGFATDLAAEDLAEAEITEPLVEFIGDLLHGRLCGE